jgi:hypothetical protein
MRVVEEMIMKIRHAVSFGCLLLVPLAILVLAAGPEPGHERLTKNTEHWQSAFASQEVRSCDQILVRLKSGETVRWTVFSINLPAQTVVFENEKFNQKEDRLDVPRYFERFISLVPENQKDLHVRCYKNISGTSQENES